MRITRRAVLGSLAGTSVGLLAGCSGSAEAPADADIIAGPGGRLVFEPMAVTVPSGTEVLWYFESASHNVSCRPEHSAMVELPDGAEPFASYGPDGHPRELVPAGGTYAHTFTTPGVHQYVCIPHQGANMTGTVRVE